MTTQSERREAVFVTRLQAVVAAVGLAVLLIANIVILSSTYGEIKSLTSQNITRIDNIERVEIPMIKALIADRAEQQSATQMQLIELRVNLQAFMGRQGVPYQAVYVEPVK